MKNKSEAPEKVNLSSNSGSKDLSSKKKALEVTFAQIDKQYGKGSVMLLGQTEVKPCNVISSGSILIDGAIGIGGLPRGRVIEIFGPESSGKTTLALQTVSQAQKAGGICAFIDAEHALDSAYATSLGINIDDLIISQPDYGEQALDIVEMLVRSAAVDLIVVDSVAALVPKAELEGDMGDTHVGLQARLMSQALRKLTPIVHKSNTAIVFINQIRQKISSMSFGNNETTSGGNALKFYSSLRIEVRKIASLKKADAHIGNKVIIKIVKNKMAAPYKRVEVDLLFNEGISKELDLLDAAIQFKVVEKSGAWLSFNGENFAQGRDQALNLLKSDKNFSDRIYVEVNKAIGIKKSDNI